MSTARLKVACTAFGHADEISTGRGRLRWRMQLLLTVIALLLLSRESTAWAQGNADQPSPTRVRYLGFKPVDPASYGLAKSAAHARATQPSSAPGATLSLMPTSSSSFQGQDMVNSQSNLSPSDSTGAIGATEYIELINQRIGVYNRSGTLLSSNTLAGWLGLDPAIDVLFDVQILWDALTNRFYYVMGDARNNFTNNLLAWGFSRSASPLATPSDWCNYQSDWNVYGTRAFPDFPKLGDSRDFLLIGVNRFSNDLTRYLGSDIVWITKPTTTATIPTCPAPGQSGVRQALTNGDGSLLSTPVPANEIDASSAGWVIGTRDPGTGSSSFLTLYRVGKSSTTGGATFTRFTVQLPSSYAYSIPRNAPQGGSAYELDTGDTRITQAVAGVDPRLGHTAIWTQHTVAGGAGARIDWFEIDTGTSTTPPAISQSGTVGHSTLYAFNGAISSDRAYQITSTGTVSKRYGSAMALGFNTSSSGTPITIQMVSKVGLGSQSAWTMVKQSTGPNEDFTCSASSPCRWGDYAGASPDPVNGGSFATGQVWFTNQWNTKSTDVTNIDWTTWNWAARP